MYDLKVCLCLFKLVKNFLNNIVIGKIGDYLILFSHIQDIEQREFLKLRSSLDEVPYIGFNTLDYLLFLNHLII